MFVRKIFARVKVYDKRAVFVYLKKYQVVIFFHHLPTTNLHKIPSVNTALIKF